MKALGIILVIVGIAALLYGGFGYNRERTIVDVGPIKATATEHKSIPIPPVVGALALIGGVVLLVSSGRRS